jgi:APA family basic amino acid/polyamine antiporter
MVDRLAWRGRHGLSTFARRESLRFNSPFPCMCSPTRCCIRMSRETQRHMGLGAATSLGVGATVGGGILVLSGVAFAETGPSAVLAFGLSGIIALLTALSFAEMASKFPQSGGTYTFAKKVVSVEVAFIVGWIIWFACIVAAVLYAIGFGQFGLMILGELAHLRGASLPAGLQGQGGVNLLAIIGSLGFGITMLFTNRSEGTWMNIGKVLLFGILIAGGCWAATRMSGAELGRQLTPFLPEGMGGLFAAMGFTFIAFHGFDLVAAVAGEIKDPARNVPRAMLGSLGIALLIYLPLLLVIALVGFAPGTSLTEAARAEPEAFVAIAANHYLGAFGYWLVLVAGVLSMLGALQANLFAASRIAMSMSRDRTMPRFFSRVHPGSGTPRMAICASVGLMVLLVLLLPNLAEAGAAASLVFLVTFALAHGITILVRIRSAAMPPPFRTPFFPLVPVLGGLSCLSLAIFQGLMVPLAGGIALGWIVLGLAAFMVLGARHARVSDAFAAARDPEIQHLRGRNPLVLVPVARPETAGTLISVAAALTPTNRGRVLMHSVVVAPPDWDPSLHPVPVDQIRDIAGEAILQAHSAPGQVEWLTTIAASPWDEIARVARSRQCASVLLGLSELGEEGTGTPLDAVLGHLDADIVTVRAQQGWQFEQVKHILVPVAGRSRHTQLMARLIGSLARVGDMKVTFLSIVSEQASAQDRLLARKYLALLASDLAPGISESRVICSDTPIDVVVEQAADTDLLILGAERLGRTQKLFGNFTLQVARKTRCPLIVISAKG